LFENGEGGFQKIKWHFDTIEIKPAKIKFHIEAR
jgi:hypothetical protein